MGVVQNVNRINRKNGYFKEDGVSRKGESFTSSKL